MNLRSFFLVAAAIGTIASVTASCGGGGNAPKIRSFTATPESVPSLGGDTTLVWDVSNADALELEPGVGAVSGTSATVHVTETTTFTLVAKKNGRADHKRATVTVLGTSTVRGVVRQAVTRVPVGNVLVWVKGHGATFTADDGTFTIEDVETPYDIAVVDVEPFTQIAIVYLGVTRADPILEVQQINAPPTFTSFVSGTTTPAAPAQTETQIYMDTNLGPPIAFDSADSWGAYPSSWFPLDDTVPTYDSVIHGLRYTLDTAGNAAAYTGYGRVQVTTTNGVSSSGVNLTLSSIGSDTTTGTVSLPGNTVLDSVTGFAIFGTPTGSFEDEGFILPTFSNSVTGDDTFSLKTPALSGAIIGARVLVSDAAAPANSARAYLPIVPGSTGVEIDLPAPPRPLFPVNDATVHRDTKFGIRGREDSLKVYEIVAPVDIFESIYTIVITDKNEFTIPDLREIGVDIFAVAPSFNWGVYAELAPVASIDDALGGNGIAGTAPVWYGQTEFFTAYTSSAVVLP